MEENKILDLVRTQVYHTVLKQKKFIFAANWKMNMVSAEIEPYLKELSSYSFSRRNPVVLFPSFPYLHLLQKFSGSKIQYGTQNLYFEEKGAFTGEVSIRMAKEYGCKYTILGHSERRNIFGELDELIGKKVKACINAGISPMLCIGENLKERKSGRYTQVLKSQLEKALAGVSSQEAEQMLIAYEPVWAIGTGESAVPSQIEETHGYIREQLILIFGSAAGSKIPILYGGSVNPDNIAKIALCRNVSGFLIGNASLDVNKFMQMMDICNEKKL